MGEKALRPEDYDDELGHGRSATSLASHVSDQDLGSSGTLLNTILTYVLQESYALAIDELRAYVEAQHDYREFKVRADRYVNYSVDLINAIKAKKSFPGLKTLSMTKQQELLSRALDHFNDLRITLRKIEQIEREIKLADVRSTVWVVKAFIHCIFAILVLAFLREVSRGVIPTAGLVVDDAFSRLTDWVFESIGF